MYLPDVTRCDRFCRRRRFTWDTRPEHWVDFASQVMGRNLTTEEWNAVFEDCAYRKTCPDN
jgi:hypothetical protein